MPTDRSLRVSEWTADQVVGTLHEPEGAAASAIALAHGAGGDRHSALLVALCDAFARLGWAALRLDLPYRQKRPKGPPSPSGAAADREGLRLAAASLSGKAEKVYLGGSSYGGRQASMLLAEQPGAAQGLLLLSYPLHPPGKPEKLRTEHLPDLRAPTLFAHGSKDAFGSIEEIERARPLIPAPTELVVCEGATHGIIQKRDGADKATGVAERIAGAFARFVAQS